MEMEKEKDTESEIPSPDKIKEEIKKLDNSKLFAEGSYIDAHDEYSWKVAIVQESTPTSIKFHYEGWSEKYDSKDVPLTSIKISPFRRFSSGYTGQPKRAYRHFTFQKDDKLQMQKKMEEIVTSRFQIEDPIKFTQVFRGELFVYVDSLLTMIPPYLLSEEDTQEILTFFDGVLGIITEWIKTVAENSEYWKLGQFYDLSHLAYPKISVAMAFNEILYLLKSFFGMNTRCSSTFLHFSDTCNEKLPEEQPEEQRILFATSWCVNHFFKSFYDQGGIEALLNLLRDPKSRISISNMNKFFGTLETAFQRYESEEINSSILSISEAIFDRIERCHENDMKEIESITPKNMLNLIDPIFKKCKQISQIDYKAKLEGFLLLTYLKNDNLMRKVQGLEMLKDNFQVHLYFSTSATGIDKKYHEQAAKFIHAIQYYKIIEMIYNDFPHPELIRRSSVIIKILLVSNNLLDKDILMLKSCFFHQHEENKIPILNIIIELAEFAPYDILEKIVVDLLKIKTEDITEIFLKFLCIYTIKLNTNITKRNEIAAKANPSDTAPTTIFTSKVCDINLFWRIMMHTDPSAKVETKIKEKALSFLIELCEASESIAAHFVAKSFEEIKSKSSGAIRAMKFLKQSYGTLKKFSKVYTLFEGNLNRKSNLFEEIVNSLVLYKKKIEEKIKNIPKIEKKDQNMEESIASNSNHPEEKSTHKDGESNPKTVEQIKENPQQTISMGTEFFGWKHEEHLRSYFDFMEFICKISNFYWSLSPAQIKTLWESFVIHPICSEETNFFFLQIMKSEFLSSNNKSTFTLLNDAGLKEIFNNYFLNTALFKLQKMNNIAYTCFKVIMVTINIKKGSFKQEKDKLLTKDGNGQGIEELWNLVFVAEDNEVKEQASKFLISIYTMLDAKFRKEIKIIAKSFAKNSLNFPNAISKTKDNVLLAVRLIKAYISEFEGEKYSKIDLKLYKQKPVLNVACLIKLPEGKYKNYRLSVCENLTLHHLLILLSSQLKVPSSMIFLTKLPKNIPITEKNERELIKTVTGPIFIEIKSDVSSIEKMPSFFIGNEETICSNLMEFIKIYEDLGEEIWSLMKDFPDNESHLRKISNLKFSLGSDPALAWSVFLEEKQSIYELIYNVRTIKRLLRAKHFLLRPYFLNYVKRFENKQGFMIMQCLLEKYLSKPLNISTVRLLKYLIQSLAVCNKFAKAEDLFNKILDFLVSYLSGIRLIPSAECDAVLIKCIPCAFSLLQALGGNISDFSAYKKQYLELLHYVFSKSKFQTVLEKISNLIILNVKSENTTQENYIKFIIQCLLYDTLQKEEEQTIEYFDLIQRILEVCPLSLLDQAYLDTSSFLPTLAVQITKAKSDTHKQGLIDLFISLYTNYKEEIFVPHHSWIDILFSNLKIVAFPSLDTTKHDSELYQFQSMNKKVLQTSLDLIFQLCLIHKEYIFEIIKIFSPLLKDPAWRSNSSADWGIYIEDIEEKKAGQTKFVGLNNPGCICYMNSVLQQLFMLPLFRRGLMGASETTDTIQSGMSLLHYMRILFGILQDGKRSSYNATQLCSMIKDYEGKHLSIYEQRDADEFFNLLMDRLETDLKKTNRSQLVQDVFGGSFANEIICIDCPHRSVRSEDFIALNIQIHNKRSLEESLKAFIESESLFGNNAYFCDRCERKVSAKKRVSLGILPNTLMIVLKRFEFDFQSNTKRKINDYLEFPRELNMEKYSQLYQNRKDIMDRGIKEEDLSEEEKLALNIKICHEYFQYRLRGVVIHMGTADFGHYLSLSYDRENTDSQDSKHWFEFNDSRVTQFNPDMMPMEAFGGGNEGKGTATMLDKKANFYGNIKNAYMLIYERVAYFHMPKVRQLYDDLKAATDIAKMEQEFQEAKLDYNLVLQSSMPEIIEQHISKESSKSNTAKIVLNSLYISLLNNFIKSEAVLRYTNYEVLCRMDLQASALEKIPGFDDLYVDHFNKWQFLFRFVLTSLLRVTLRSQIPPILRILTNVLKNDLALSMWILETFSHPLIIYEFYFHCTSTQARYFVSSLLISAFHLVMQAEEKSFSDPSNEPINLLKQISCIEGKLELPELKDIVLSTKSIERGKILHCHLFLFNYLALFPKIFVNKTGFPEYCFLLSLINRRHPEVQEYLLSKHFLGLVLEILLETQGDYLIEATTREVLLIEQDISLGFANPSGTKKEQRTTGLNFLLDNRNKQFKFLFDIVNTLLSATKNFKPTNKYSMEDREIALIKNLTVDSVLNKLFLYATSNVARQALSEILVSLSFSQRENAKGFMETLLVKCARAELSDLPLYLMCLQKMLKIKDQYAEMRASTLLAHLNLILVKYVPRSFFHYSYITDMLLNYARESTYMQKYFSENPDKFSFLLSWLKENSYPAQREIYWFKSQLKQIEIRREVSKAVRALCKEHSDKKIKLLKLLLSPSGTTTKSILSIDFKEEEHHNLFHGDFTESCVLKKEFNIKVNGEWKIGVVLSSCDTMLNFSYEQTPFEKREKWIKIGSSKIQPQNTRVNHETELKCSENRIHK